MVSTSPFIAPWQYYEKVSAILQQNKNQERYGIRPCTSKQAFSISCMGNFIIKSPLVIEVNIS
jgi:hypothetical protein